MAALHSDSAKTTQLSPSLGPSHCDLLLLLLLFLSLSLYYARQIQRRGGVLVLSLKTPASSAPTISSPFPNPFSLLPSMFVFLLSPPSVLYPSVFAFYLLTSSFSSSSSSLSPFLFLRPPQRCTVPDPRWLGPPLCPDNNIKVTASFTRVGLTLGRSLLPLGRRVFCKAFIHSVPSTIRDPAMTKAFLLLLLLLIV
ncbi:hypothetical protein E2C01_092852 [Portunus trituberculatus]|uniref:Uncharacterized protein n=1 Tax=Portunus trituberculatus TaxID=210409 RepID=A0A5B7JT04_PORTR|nr:hypothetical protein [Portunus trituberculatus]